MVGTRLEKLRIDPHIEFGEDISDPQQDYVAGWQARSLDELGTWHDVQYMQYQSDLERWLTEHGYVHTCCLSRRWPRSGVWTRIGEEEKSR